MDKKELFYWIIFILIQLIPLILWLTLRKKLRIKTAKIVTEEIAQGLERGEIKFEPKDDFYDSAKSEADRLGVSVEEILENTEHRNYKKVPIVDWELAIINSKR